MVTDVEEHEHVPAAAVVAQRGYRLLARRGLLQIALLCGVALGVLAAVHVHLDARARRARILERGEAERAQLGAEAQVLDRVDAAIFALAKDAGEVPASPDLAELLRGRGLYLRAVLDEVGSARAIHAAAKVARKDAFVGCLLHPPADASDGALHEAAIALRWRVDLDEATPLVEELEVLDRGLRPISRAFLDEVARTWDPTSLRLLEREREERTPHQIAQARRAAEATWLAVLLDEMPTGFPEPGGPALADTMRASRLDDVISIPHDVRAAVIDLRTGKVVARTRKTVDAGEVRVPNAFADAEELHACQAAVALR